MSTTLDGPIIIDNRPVVVHEPTQRQIPPLLPYLRSVWELRPLIWQLSRAAVKAKNYNTVLGRGWILIEPLTLALIFLLLRSVVRPLGSGDDRNMLIAHLIAGLFFFFFVRGAVMDGSKAVIKQRGMVLNTTFPKAIFPVEAVLRCTLDLIPMVVVYMAFHLLLDRPVTLALLYLPLVVLCLIGFGLGGALLLTPLNVFSTDMRTFIPHLTRVWLYVTPILYMVREIPDDLRFIFMLNPLFPSFAAIEQLFNGETPSVGYLLGAAAWAVGTLVLGTVAFLVKERDYAVRL